MTTFSQMRRPVTPERRARLDILKREMERPPLHHVRIESEGEAVLTRVYLDGQEVRGLTFVSVGIREDGMVETTLRLYARVEYEGKSVIVVHATPVVLANRD